MQVLNKNLLHRPTATEDSDVQAQRGLSGLTLLTRILERPCKLFL